jgi:hypothetical protein
VMGSRQTRTLSQPKKAAAVTMMLTSASAVMALTLTYLIQMDLRSAAPLENRIALKFEFGVLLASFWIVDDADSRQTWR